MISVQEPWFTLIKLGQKKVEGYVKVNLKN